MTKIKLATFTLPYRIHTIFFVWAEKNGFLFTYFAGSNFISVLSSCTIIVYLTGLWELGPGSASAGVLINEALSPDCGDGSETDTRSAASGYLQI